MSPMLRALLCVSGLAACSQTVATGAQGPVDAAAQQSTSSKGRLVQPAARESPVLTQLNASPPPSAPPSNATSGLPAGDTRTTSTGTPEETDPGLRQRIRQAAMADGLL